MNKLTEWETPTNVTECTQKMNIAFVLLECIRTCNTLASHVKENPYGGKAEEVAEYLKQGFNSNFPFHAGSYYMDDKKVIAGTVFNVIEYYTEHDKDGNYIEEVKELLLKLVSMLKDNCRKALRELTGEVTREVERWECESINS